MTSIDFACPRCATRLSFTLAQAGASGPCYACGQTVVVPSPPAPTAAAAAPAAPSNRDLEIAPLLTHHQAMETVAREGAKNRIQVLGMRVLQIGQKVGTRENFGAALWGGSIRVDHVQAIKLRSPRGDFFLFIPWSGNMRLAHEMASVLPGGLPSCLCLSRGLLGAFSAGRYEGSNGGDRDPLAVAAEPDYPLHDNIQWDWESGRMRIKLHWGLQAVPFDTTPSGPRTLHVMHTADIGILFREYGLSWYLDRRDAFAGFIQKHASHAPPPRRAWNPAPVAALFLDDFYL